MTLPQDPIFIVGYPRSGTTLLQRLLATQPGILSFPETHYFSVIEKRAKLDELGNILPSSLPAVFETMAQKTGCQPSHEERASLGRQAEARTLDSKALFEFLVGRMLYAVHPAACHRTCFRWLEKTPHHAHCLDRILTLYPRAQVLHVLRHPVPAVVSRKLKLPLNRETPLAELARRWSRLVEDVDGAEHRYPSRIHRLKYEDLMGDMNRELAFIADFLHVDLDVTVLSHARHARIAGPLILPAESWKREDAGRDIVSTNEGYKERIARDDAARIEDVTAEAMKAHGYTAYFG